MNSRTNFYILFLAFVSLCFCASCVQKTYRQTVEFEVDLRDFSEVQTVGVRGNFAPLSWEQDTPLTDADGDGIWTGNTVLDTPYLGVEFKFVLNGGTFELQDQPNRIVEFKEGKLTRVQAVFDQP